MSGKSKTVQNFNLNDRVFAKMKSYPIWPAKIIEIIGNNKFKVFFYGTHDCAIVPKSNVTKYDSMKNNIPSSKLKSYLSAVKEIKQDVNNKLFSCEKINRCQKAASNSKKVNKTLPKNDAKNSKKRKISTNISDKDKAGPSKKPKKTMKSIDFSVFSPAELYLECTTPEQVPVRMHIRDVLTKDIVDKIHHSDSCHWKMLALGVINYIRRKIINGGPVPHQVQLNIDAATIQHKIASQQSMSNSNNNGSCSNIALDSTESKETTEFKYITDCKDTMDSKDSSESKDFTDSEDATIPENILGFNGTTESKETIECKGILDFINTTDSMYTTDSRDTTESKDITNSKDATDSNGITKFKDTTNSKDITESKAKTNSKNTTNSNDITESKDITNSKNITDSNDYIKSKIITNFENITDTSYAMGITDSNEVSELKNITNSKDTTDSMYTTEFRYTSGSTGTTESNDTHNAKDTPYLNDVKKSKGINNADDISDSKHTTHLKNTSSTRKSQGNKHSKKRKNKKTLVAETASVIKIQDSKTECIISKQETSCKSLEEDISIAGNLRFERQPETKHKKCSKNNTELEGRISLNNDISVENSTNLEEEISNLGSSRNSKKQKMARGKVKLKGKREKDQDKKDRQREKHAIEKDTTKEVRQNLSNNIMSHDNLACLSRDNAEDIVASPLYKTTNNGDTNRVTEETNDVTDNVNHKNMSCTGSTTNNTPSSSDYKRDNSFVENNNEPTQSNSQWLSPTLSNEKLFAKYINYYSKRKLKLDLNEINNLVRKNLENKQEQAKEKCESILDGMEPMPQVIDTNLAKTIGQHKDQGTKKTDETPKINNTDLIDNMYKESVTMSNPSIIEKEPVPKFPTLDLYDGLVDIDKINDEHESLSQNTTKQNGYLEESNQFCCDGGHHTDTAIPTVDSNAHIVSTSQQYPYITNSIKNSFSQESCYAESMQTLHGSSGNVVSRVIVEDSTIVHRSISQPNNTQGTSQQHCYSETAHTSFVGSKSSLLQSHVQKSTINQSPLSTVQTSTIHQRMSPHVENSNFVNQSVSPQVDNSSFVNQSVSPQVAENLSFINQTVRPQGVENSSFSNQTIIPQVSESPSFINQSVSPQVAENSSFINQSVSPQVAESPSFINQTASPQVAESPSFINQSVSPQVAESPSFINQSVSPQVAESPSFINQSVSPQVPESPSFINQTASPQVAENSSFINQTASPQVAESSSFINQSVSQTNAEDSSNLSRLSADCSDLSEAELNDRVSALFFKESQALLLHVNLMKYLRFNKNRQSAVSAADLYRADFVMAELHRMRLNQFVLLRNPQLVFTARLIATSSKDLTDSNNNNVAPKQNHINSWKKSYCAESSLSDSGALCFASRGSDDKSQCELYRKQLESTSLTFLQYVARVLQFNSEENFYDQFNSALSKFWRRTKHMSWSDIIYVAEQGIQNNIWN